MALNGTGSGLKRPFDGDDFDPSKRLRSSQPASRVVFVCGLPADCLESELLALCCPFAVVEKSLMIPQKRQAFVQLPDVTSASNLVTFYQTRDALIRGKKIFFEFSNRNEITVRQENDGPPPYQQQQQQPYEQLPPPRVAPHQQHPSAQYPPQQEMQPFRRDTGGQPGLLSHDGPRRGIGPPNQILMVSVSKIEYDVTVEVLQQVFQKFGNVEKIVTFWKDNEFKALVQMESIDQAQAAQSALDGRDIYTGCNQLSIVFSRHPELRVRYNDDRSNIDRELVPPHRLFTLFGCFGDVLRIKIMFRKRDTALIQFVDDVHSTSALDHLDGVYVFGKKLRVDYSKHTSVSMPHADADRFEIENTLDFSNSPLHRYRRRSPQEAVSPCPLLHISGIPMELQRNENALVDLFAHPG
eukprot:jgi/Phyca11/19035/fgenesh1_pg.PHYCAscaffold_43_\